MTTPHQELAKWLRDYAKRNCLERGGVIPEYWTSCAALVEEAERDKARLRWIIENCEVSTEYYQIESLEQIDKLMEESKR